MGEATASVSATFDVLYFSTLVIVVSTVKLKIDNNM